MATYSTSTLSDYMQVFYLFSFINFTNFMLILDKSKGCVLI